MMKNPKRPEDRDRAERTTRGKRKLSYEEAYSRRTTDSSRARVMELYGKTSAPKVTIGGRAVPVGKGEDSRRITPAPSSPGLPRYGSPPNQASGSSGMGKKKRAYKRRIPKPGDTGGTYRYH